MLTGVRDKLLTAALVCALLLMAAPEGRAAEVNGVSIARTEGAVTVNAHLALDGAQLEEIKKGVVKELIFLVDLFRTWKNWPDEFIVGREISRTLHCDNVKQEYTSTVTEYERSTVKRFKSCDELIAWATSVDKITVNVLSDLEPAEYYVRVTAESRVLRLPPLIDVLFFFVKQKDFSVQAESERFNIEAGASAPPAAK